jgi:hypothetical protein
VVVVLLALRSRLGFGGGDFSPPDVEEVWFEGGGGGRTGGRWAVLEGGAWKDDADGGAEGDGRAWRRTKGSWWRIIEGLGGPFCCMAVTEPPTRVGKRKTRHKCEQHRYVGLA